MTLLTKQIPVLNKQSLAEKVELLVQREQMRYSEAVIHICEEHGIDPIDMAKIIITSPLKAKIERESIRLNTVRGKKRVSTAIL
jgi:hydrogenase maturation factor